MKLSKIFGLLLLIALVVRAPALPNAPAWVNGIAPGTWAAVSQNTIADVDPAKDPAVNPDYPGGAPWRGNTGHASVVRAWCGGAFAVRLGTYGSLIAYGGGHQGYYGDEVYAFDLGTLGWSRLSDPYGSLTHPGSISFPVTDGIWPDGSPSVPHTYDQVEYHPPTNSFVALRCMANNTPNNVPVAAIFSLSAKTWRRSPRNSMDPIASGGWSIYDPVRDLFWAEGGSGTNAFSSFDPDTVYPNGWVGRWTNYPYKIGHTDAVAALDSLNDVIVVTDFRNGSGVFGIDLKNPQAAETQLTEGGTPPSKSSAHGWEWSNARQAFIYWRRGGDVYEFKRPAGNWRTEPWSWNRITASGNTVVPEAMDVDNGIYSRFRVARFNGMEIAVVVNNVGGSVYAFRVPDGTNDAEAVLGTPIFEMSVSPNPYTGSGVITFFRGFSEGEIRVLDMKGRQVARFVAGGKTVWDGKYGRGEAWAPGVYLIEWSIGGRRAAQEKFIVVK